MESDSPAPRNGAADQARLRIAMVNDIAGVARAEVALLAAVGFAVDFYPLPIMGGRLSIGLKALIAPIRMARYVPIVRRIRAGRYDVVHVHFVSQGVVGVFSKAPFIVHAHGSDVLLNLRRPIMGWLSRRIMRAAGQILCSTPDLMRHLAAYGEKATFLGNPVDPGLLSAFSVPSSITRVLIFTRLAAMKGADQVFAHARDIAARFDLTTIDSGDWAAEYRRLYGDVVRFVEPVPHDAVRPLLANFDAVIGQMHRGVLGLSELEAMACGRPVIMRLEPGMYGDDPPPVISVAGGHEILPALHRLALDPLEVDRVSRAGLAWVRRHHDPQVHLSRLVEIYDRVLKVGGGQAWRTADVNRPR